MCIFCGKPPPLTQRDERRSRSDRCEEAKQGHDPVLLSLRRETIQQGTGQPIVGERRRQTSPLPTPKPRGWEVLPPPPLPAHEGAPVNPELCVQLGGTTGRNAVGHGRYQDDHDTEVHAATQKAQGRRGLATSASVAITTEAEPPLPVGGEVGGTPARLAGVVGLMESTAARAPRGARLISEIPVERVEKVKEPGVAQQGMAH